MGGQEEDGGGAHQHLVQLLDRVCQCLCKFRETLKLVLTSILQLEFEYILKNYAKLIVYVVAVTTFKKDKEVGQDSFNIREEEPAQAACLRGEFYARDAMALCSLEFSSYDDLP